MGVRPISVAILLNIILSSFDCVGNTLGCYIHNFVEKT